MPVCLSTFGRWNREWNLRRLALLSLPALLIGLLLRVMLTVDMPYGGFHPDTSDLLYTPSRLIHKHQFKLNPKKTFLSPALYTATFAIPGAPVLVAVPIAQHMVGLATVAMVALLCRFWFRHWEWIVVPVTLLVAIDPNLIWYEHTLMAETQFVACTVLLALVGTIYAMKPGRWTFGALCVALVLEAGARPEGKLLFGFGFLLVFLVALPRWRQAFPWLGILLAVALATHLCTRTSQAGLLLYTSLVRLSPAQSKVAPGIEAYIGEIRDKLASQWEKHPVYPRSSMRHALAREVAGYLKDRGLPHNTEAVEKLCSRLAFEICRTRVGKLPSLVLHKLRVTASAAPADGFGPIWFSKKQAKAVDGSRKMILQNGEALTGEPLEDNEALDRFFSSAYSLEKVGWFEDFSKRWSDAVTSLRTPLTKYPSGYKEPGIPVYMLVAMAGLLWMMRRHPWQFQVAWGLGMIGLLFTVLLTGNIRARFRLFFEPFWFLYCAALIDCILYMFRAREPKPQKGSAPCP